MVDGQTIRVGDAVSLQPFVSSPTAAEDERELVHIGPNLNPNPNPNPDPNPNRNPNPDPNPKPKPNPEPKPNQVSLCASRPLV